ncbi:MAG: hypothetical protein ACI87T_001728 [Planctomycetota bacterium]
MRFAPSHAADAQGAAFNPTRGQSPVFFGEMVKFRFMEVTLMAQLRENYKQTVARREGMGNKDT